MTNPATITPDQMRSLTATGDAFIAERPFSSLHNKETFFPYHLPAESARVEIAKGAHFAHGEELCCACEPCTLTESEVIGAFDTLLEFVDASVLQRRLICAMFDADITFLTDEYGRYKGDR